MDERKNGLSDELGQPEMGLTFEFGAPEPEQLVFGAPEPEPVTEPESEESMLEIEIVSAPMAHNEEEFSIPDAFEASAREATPVYVPRFTGASENYTKVVKSVNRTADSYNSESQLPKIDPTSEIDEGVEAPHVVVSSAPVKLDTGDESIHILKFDQSQPGESKTPEQLEEEALMSIIVKANAPARKKAEEVIEEAPEPEKNEPAPEQPLPELPDPFLELTLVDYTAADNDPETPSAEEAPSESGAKASLGEFSRPAQRDAVKDRFLDHLMSIKIRLIGAIVVALALISASVLSIFSIDILALIGLGSVPYAAAVIDLQFSICLALFALPEVARAARAVARKMVAPELAIPVSLFAIAVHDLTVAFSGAPAYPVFGVLLSLQVLAAIVASYHKVSADFISFKLISRNTVKSFLDKRLTRTLPRENLALDGAVDEYSSKIARMFKTAFVSDFFSRSSVAVENSFNNIVMILSSLGISLVTALISWLVGTDGFVGFTSAWAFVFLLAFPSFSMLVHKLPHHGSAKETDADKGAFVGESSLFACSDIDVIAYEDTEIFGFEDISIKKVHLYGKAYNAGKAMHSMHAIFSAAHGPLEAIFAASVEGTGATVTEVSIEDDGISGMLGGRSVAAGTLEYMQRKGIAIPAEDSSANFFAGDSTRVMYGAEDGEVYVKFFIRYSFSEEFTMLLPHLKGAGIVPLIYTRDPNLTVDFFKMLTLGEDIIRVMKKHTVPSLDDKVYRRVSAGIVTLGDKLDAVNMVLHAKKYSAYQSALSVSELIAMLAGAVVGSMFALTGSLSVPMVAVGALQLVWCAYLYIRTHYMFKDRKSKDKDNAV